MGKIQNKWFKIATLRHHYKRMDQRICNSVKPFNTEVFFLIQISRYSKEHQFVEQIVVSTFVRHMGNERAPEFRVKGITIPAD